jgi:hypothetical protein
MVVGPLEEEDEVRNGQSVKWLRAVNVGFMLN